MQVVEMSKEKQFEMYMKCTKKELTEMLIECNRILSSIRQIYGEVQNPHVHIGMADSGFTFVGDYCRLCGTSINLF